MADEYFKELCRIGWMKARSYFINALDKEVDKNVKHFQELKNQVLYFQDLKDQIGTTMSTTIDINTILEAHSINSLDIYEKNIKFPKTSEIK